MEFGPLRLTLEELKAADDTDYADESSYDGSIRVIRVIRGSSCPEKWNRLKTASCHCWCDARCLLVMISIENRINPGFAIMTAIIVAVIVYGSLYPFGFYNNPDP